MDALMALIIAAMIVTVVNVIIALSENNLHSALGWISAIVLYVVILHYL